MSHGFDIGKFIVSLLESENPKGFCALVFIYFINDKKVLISM